MSRLIKHLQYDKELPDFEKLSEDNFIWIPLTSVPIDEHYPINSMRQPALKIFNLLTWTTIEPLTREQRFVQKLALQHEEMGYFLLHYKDVFGIIGVDEYDGDYTPGRAVVFNCVEKKYPVVNGDNVPMLSLIYSNLVLPCRTFLYAPGKFSNYTTIYHESCNGREDWDD